MTPKRRYGWNGQAQTDQTDQDIPEAVDRFLQTVADDFALILDQYGGTLHMEETLERLREGYRKAVRDGQAP
jgi:hypothetical protein